MTYGKDLRHRLAGALTLVVPLGVECVAQPKCVILARHVLAPVVRYRRQLGPAERRVGLASLSVQKEQLGCQPPWSVSRPAPSTAGRRQASRAMPPIRAEAAGFKWETRTAF
jgi:hypothetical protein